MLKLGDFAKFNAFHTHVRHLRHVTKTQKHVTGLKNEGAQGTKGQRCVRRKGT